MFNAFTQCHLDKELANLSDKLKQEQALSEQKGALNDETIDCELEIHCCMTFKTLDKELATLDEKLKQQQVLSEQKGTSNNKIDCESCKLIYCCTPFNTKDKELVSVRAETDSHHRKTREWEDKCLGLRDELNSSLAKMAVKQEAMYKLEETKENL